MGVNLSNLSLYLFESYSRKKLRGSQKLHFIVAGIVIEFNLVVKTLHTLQHRKLGLNLDARQLKHQ